MDVVVTDAAAGNAVIGKTTGAGLAPVGEAMDSGSLSTSGKRKRTGGKSLLSSGICGPPVAGDRLPASRRKFVVVPG